MGDTTEKTEEKTEEIMACFRDLEEHAGPIHFTDKPIDDKALAAISDIPRTIEEAFNKCLDNILDLPPR